MESEEYVNSQFEGIRVKAVSFLKGLEAKNQTKTIEMFRLVSSKADACAKKYNKLEEINECKDQAVRIEALHSDTERGIIVGGINELGSCVMQAHHLFKLHNSKSSLESKIGACYEKFQSNVTLSFENLLDSDLKNLKTMK